MIETTLIAVACFLVTFFLLLSIIYTLVEWFSDIR